MKVLVLAGGIPQLELIKALRSRFENVEIILADYLESPAAKDFADKFYRKSTLDIAAIEEIAVTEKVDFLITVCTDQALNTVAEVSEKLGLPCYIDSQTGKNVTNKRYMKKVFQKYGIPSAKYEILDAPIQEKPEAFFYPLVVKPVDCNSSKGVIKVTNNEELFVAVQNAIAYSRTNNAIIEEFVEGKELSVDAYIHKGKAEILCVTESQKTKSNDQFLIFRTVYPADIPDYAQNAVAEIAQKITDAFHLAEGPMLIQMLYSNHQMYVLEFSARTGGGLKYQMIRQLTGVDILDATILATIGKGQPVRKQASVRFLTDEYLYAYDGIFDHLEGFEELLEDGVITNYFQYKVAGDLVNLPASSGDRVASITITADSMEEMIRKHETAMARVHVIDDRNHDILNREITYPLHHNR